MKKTFAIIFLFNIITGNYIYGQKQEKLFYDKDWKTCSESKAAYYRIINFDNDGKPIGKIHDYFITGEIQSVVEGVIALDKKDDHNSKFFGIDTGYYKSGNKQFESSRDSMGNVLWGIQWYESGAKKLEYTAKNGKYDGMYISYYENGKLKYKSEFKEGKPVDKWYEDCDEFGRCQKVFVENFQTTENKNNWNLVDNKDIESRIIEKKGLQMEAKTESGFYQFIHLPIDINKNFTIETTLSFVKGNEAGGQGLIWGYKNEENFYYFIISEKGSYQIGAFSDGISLPSVKWQKSEFVNQSTGDNLIKLNKVNDKVYFSINGNLVYNDNFYSFRGNDLGFIVTAKKRVIFKDLIVRQDIDNSDVAINNSTSIWKGNGSGFIIDKRGYILTNYHVIDDMTEIEVDLTQNGQKNSYKAKVISSDKQNDLAVIKIVDDKFKPYPKLPYAFKTEICDVGTSVFTLGYPMASVMGNEVKFTDGKISSKTGYQGDITAYQISVPIQPGNSGAPLFDDDGNLVGIVNAKIMKADNVSYAIKANYAKNLIEVLPETVILPNDNTLVSKSLTEKIKSLSEYIVLIKIR